MMNYKDNFYAKYSSTHIAHRKGNPSLDGFRARAVYFQKRWGGFFPKDKSAKIVDVGCGNGSLVWWLQQSGYENVEGIDISLEQIEAARQLGVNNVTQADLKAFLKARAYCYDVVVLRDVIEHFKREEIVEILGICLTALKRNGTIIIQVPNAEAPFFGRIRYGDFTHEIAFSWASLAQLLSMVGVTKFQFYPTEPVVSGLKSLIRFPLWKLVEAFYKFLLFAELGRGRRIVTQGIIAVGVKSD